MKLIKVNKTTYVNPERVIRVSREKDVIENPVVDVAPEEVSKKSWYIYTQEGKIKTDKNFNIRAFRLESRQGGIC